MNFELGDTDKLNVFRQELTRNRIALLPPDVNHSFPTFTVEECGGKAAIRYALSAIKGIGEAAMRGVVEARKNGPFRDLFDFAERIDAQAQKLGLTKGDDYLAQLRWGDEVERPGAPADVAAALRAELESANP